MRNICSLNYENTPLPVLWIAALLHLLFHLRYELLLLRALLVLQAKRLILITANGSESALKSSSPKTFLISGLYYGIKARSYSYLDYFLLLFVLGFLARTILRALFRRHLGTGGDGVAGAAGAGLHGDFVLEGRRQRGQELHAARGGHCLSERGVNSGTNANNIPQLK